MATPRPPWPCCVTNLLPGIAVAAPFRPRFSDSCTVKFSAGDAPSALASLADPAAWFPGLRKLNRDGLWCAAETPLAVVHGVEVYERVWEGPKMEGSTDSPFITHASSGGC